MAAGIKAGLTRATLAHLQEAGAHTAGEFLLVPEPSTGSESSAASAVRSLADSLPQVWQDLFVATRVSQSSSYLDGLACSPQQPAPTEGAAGTSGPSCEPSSASTLPDPSLGISRDTAFTQFLSPEALVRVHRLGKPEVRRLYQALQVYTLGFHQMCVELTAHATNRGLLLLALWRSFAMLWDSALQVVFPAETVQTSRERQAALLTSERLLEELQEAEARMAELEQENQDLRVEVESLGVQVFSAQADATVAHQGTAEAEEQLRLSRQEAAEAAKVADQKRLELLQLQDKMAGMGAPQEDLYTRVQQLEGIVKEKQNQLTAAAKRAAEALAGKEEAKQATRAERLAREAAERRAGQLQAELDHTKQQLQAVAAAAAAGAQQAAADAAARKTHAEAEASGREDDTARLATERVGWQRAATQAEAEIAAVRQQLEDAQAALAEERVRSKHLAASLWPLAEKIKTLEAAAGPGRAGAAAMGAVEAG